MNTHLLALRAFLDRDCSALFALLTAAIVCGIVFGLAAVAVS